jgi:hypothetical protein
MWNPSALLDTLEIKSMDVPTFVEALEAHFPDTLDAFLSLSLPFFFSCALLGMARDTKNVHVGFRKASMTSVLEGNCNCQNRGVANQLNSITVSLMICILQSLWEIH